MSGRKHGHDSKHSHCEHCLHFCGHCDTVYCCDCNREWGKCHQSHYPWTYSYPWTTTTIPCSSGTASDITLTSSVDNVTADRIHAHTN